MASISLTNGDDSYTGTLKPDRIEGLAGHDRIWGLAGADMLWGGDGDDTLFGGNGHDRLHGDVGGDRLWGQGGDDWLYVSGDGDEAHGGEGRDRVVYRQSEGPVAIDLGAGTGPDSYDSIEDVDGSLFGDRIVGDAGDNRLRGHGGDDVLIGGAGDDVLLGSEDSDRLEGGAGDDVLTGGRVIDFRRDDVFVFHLAGDTLGSLGDLGQDVVRDMATGEDKLDLLAQTADGGLGGLAIFDLLDSNGDGIWNGADEAVSIRTVTLDGGTSALSTVVDLGDVLDPSGGLVATITFFGTTGIGRGDVLDTIPT